MHQKKTKKLPQFGSSLELIVKDGKQGLPLFILDALTYFHSNESRVQAEGLFKLDVLDYKIVGYYRDRYNRNGKRKERKWPKLEKEIGSDPAGPHLVITLVKMFLRQLNHPVMVSFVWSPYALISEFNVHRKMEYYKAGAMDEILCRGIRLYLASLPWREYNMAVAVFLGFLWPTLQASNRRCELTKELPRIIGPCIFGEQFYFNAQGEFQESLNVFLQFILEHCSEIFTDQKAPPT